MDKWTNTNTTNGCGDIRSTEEARQEDEAFNAIKNQRDYDENHNFNTNDN